MYHKLQNLKKAYQSVKKVKKNCVRKINLTLYAQHDVEKTIEMDD